MAAIHVRIDDDDYKKFKEALEANKVELGLRSITEFYKLVTYAFIKDPQSFAVKLGDEK